MLNVLIIEDNPHQLKNVANIISSQIPEIKLYNISFDGESILKLLKEPYIDIIILDLKLPGISGIDIVNYMEQEKLYKYKNSVIAFSGEIDMITEIMHSPYLFSYSLKGAGYENLLKNLKLLITEKIHNINIDNLKIKIDHELQYLNYNFSYAGTKYLRETIIEVYKNKDNFDGNFKKNIYPIIAKRYKKRPNTIYCDIKQATNTMIIECDESILIKYFNYNYFVKPKINEVIFTILNKIKKT